MRAAASKYLSGITLLGVGGVFLAFWLNHRVDQYLHPQFRPGVLAAGILLVLAGALRCVTKPSRRCCVGGECVHEANDNPARRVVSFGVLVLPLVVGSLVSKDAYDQVVVLNRNVGQRASVLAARSSSSIRKTETTPAPAIPSGMLGGDIDESASKDPATAATANDGRAADPASAGMGEENTPESDAYLPRGADGNVALEVTDLLYGEAEPSLRKVFVGKTVEVVGQYLPGGSGDRFKLVRMLIVCCAADARPMMITVEATRPVQQPDMAWVKVIGTPNYEVVNGKAHLTFKAQAVMPADPPADAMLY